MDFAESAVTAAVKAFNFEGPATLKRLLKLEQLVTDNKITGFSAIDKEHLECRIATCARNNIDPSVALYRIILAIIVVAVVCAVVFCVLGRIPLDWAFIVLVGSFLGIFVVMLGENRIHRLKLGSTAECILSEILQLVFRQDKTLRESVDIIMSSPDRSRNEIIFALKKLNDKHYIEGFNFVRLGYEDDYEIRTYGYLNKNSYRYFNKCTKPRRIKKFKAAASNSNRRAQSAK
jgi:hypothetical protein